MMYRLIANILYLFQGPLSMKSVSGHDQRRLMEAVFVLNVIVCIISYRKFRVFSHAAEGTGIVHRNYKLFNHSKYRIIAWYAHISYQILQQYPSHHIGSFGLFPSKLSPLAPSLAKGFHTRQTPTFQRELCHQHLYD